MALDAANNKAEDGGERGIERRVSCGEGRRVMEKLSNHLSIMQLKRNFFVFAPEPGDEAALCDDTVPLKKNGVS